MSKPQIEHYADFLQKILNSRIQRRPSYSLRAFARDLDLHPSSLSRILNRKQALTLKSAVGITQALGFSTEESKQFFALMLNEKISEMKNFVYRAVGIQL